MIRVLALLVALLLVALAGSPASAAIAVVQTVECDFAAATTCTTPAITTTTGNLLIASMSIYCNSGTCPTMTVTDAKSNTYGDAVAAFQSVWTGGHVQYKAGATGGSSHTFTATSSANSYTVLSLTEVSGAAASPLDQTATGGTNRATTHASASTATTAQANELLLGFGTHTASSTTMTPTASGFTTLTSTDGSSGHGDALLTGYRIVSATGAYNYSFTTPSNVDGAIAISTWKEAVAAAGVRQQCSGCGADRKVIE